MAEQQQFYILLGNLMSPDNNVRKHSEVREESIAVYLCGSLGGCWDDYAKANSLATQSCSARTMHSHQAHVHCGPDDEL